MLIVCNGAQKVGGAILRRLPARQQSGATLALATRTQGGRQSRQQHLSDRFLL